MCYLSFSSFCCLQSNWFQDLSQLYTSLEKLKNYPIIFSSFFSSQIIKYNFFVHTSTYCTSLKMFFFYLLPKSLLANTFLYILPCFHGWYLWNNQQSIYLSVVIMSACLEAYSSFPWWSSLPMNDSLKTPLLSQITIN